MRLRTQPPRVTTAAGRIKPSPKTADRDLTQGHWRALVAEIIGERGRVCEGCGRRGCYLEADHVVERRDGGALLDKRNVVLLCAKCHGKKTMAARARRMGVGVSP